MILEKNLTASVCWKKKIACSINEIEKILALRKQEKNNVAKLFDSSFLGGFTKFQQNRNHSG